MCKLLTRLKYDLFNCLILRRDLVLNVSYIVYRITGFIVYRITVFFSQSVNFAITARSKLMYNNLRFYVSVS